MLAPAVARRVRPSFVVAGSLAVSAVGFLVLTQISGSSGLGWLIAGFLLVYVGIAPLVVLSTDLIVGAAPPDKAGSAAAMSETSTELGVALGIAILGSVGSAVYHSQMDGAVPAGIPVEAAAAARDSLAGAAAVAENLPTDTAARLLDVAGQSFAQGLDTVAALSAVVAAGLAVVAAVLLRHVRPAAHPEASATGEAGPEG
jgi:DHA2 family multidrug resistance protein-like MFS transporter